MLDFDKYKVGFLYPQKPSKPRVDDRHATSASARLYLKEIEEWELKMVEHEAKRAAWHKAEADAVNAFKKDVLEEYGLAGHPKADKVYALAWQEGHSAGLMEVAGWVQKLSELVLD